MIFSFLDIEIRHLPAVLVAIVATPENY